MSGDRSGATPLLYQLDTLAQLIQKLLKIACVLLEHGVRALGARFDQCHSSLYPLNNGGGGFMAMQLPVRCIAFSMQHSTSRRQRQAIVVIRVVAALAFGCLSCYTDAILYF